MLKVHGVFAALVILLHAGVAVSQQQHRDTALQDVSMIACHNCYDQAYASSITDVLQYTTVLELDIWDTKRWLGIGGRGAMDRDWFVRHEPHVNGNRNCCGGSLKDCMATLASWSNSNPLHPCMVIFIDKKENWSRPRETRNPVDLDSLIRSIIPSHKLVTPAQIQGDSNSLRQMVLSAGWPAARSLRGKFLFILTDATLITSRDPLNEYVHQRGKNAVCFIAPQAADSLAIEKPFNADETANGHVVIFNLPASRVGLGPIVHRRNYLSRVYNIQESGASIEQARSLYINFIALFNYSFHP